MNIGNKGPAEAFPLAWPIGQSRTKTPQSSRFRVSPGAARDNLLAEITRLGCKNSVISSDMPVRKDGLPYANRTTPKDPGVAVYFQKGDKQMCFACDKWDTIRDNLWAIKKTIEAIRGIERWGSSDMMNRAFSAFEALPAPGAETHWREVLGCSDVHDIRTVKERYKRLRTTQHPDHGGDSNQFNKIQVAYDQAKQELTI